MSDRTALARQALRAAIQLRRNLTLPRDAPVNAFDIAVMCGLDVRFLNTPTLEGMFVRDPGLRILLPSLKHRPRSRVLFSCAHEVAHHQFGHGIKADEYLQDAKRQNFSDEEYLADSFARHLLMPRAAVVDSFRRRQWDEAKPTPHQVYQVCGELGVGYETLLHQLASTLELISRSERDRLLKISPKTIKLDLTGDPAIRELIVVDSHWKDAPIDVECGESLLLAEGVGADCELLRCIKCRGGRSLHTAVKSGRQVVTIDGCKVTLRVARQHYIGPFHHRYLADPDEH